MESSACKASSRALGFPKGHAEEGENPYETAARELKEETSLYIVEQLDSFPLQENYLFRKKDIIVYKLVDYFLASVGGKVEILKKELSDFEWVNLPEAKEKVTFKEAKKLCAEIENRLKIPL